MRMTTIADARTWYGNSGIVNWEHPAGFDEGEFVRFIWSELETGIDLESPTVNEDGTETDPPDIVEMYSRFTGIPMSELA